MDQKPRRLHEVAAPIFTVDICITHGNNVLMFKRSPAKKVFPGWLALPGGHIDEGENPLSAAIREIKEEVGITLSPTDIQLKFVATHYHIDRNELFVVFGFLATLAGKPKEIVSNAEGEAVWMDKADLLKSDTVFPPVAYYFPHVLGGKPGIIYNYSIWKDSQLVKVVTEHTDANS